ncbi:unnamed protein product, partial [Urochloa humidicola]
AHLRRPLHTTPTCVDLAAPIDFAVIVGEAEVGSPSFFA